MAKLTPEGFENFFKYFQGESQQKSGIKMLYDAMPVSLLDDEANWIVEYREAPAVNEAGSKIPQQAVDIITEFEGFRSAVYDDGVGVATIGIGATFWEDGRKVDWNDKPITLERAQQLLSYHLQYFWGVQESTIPFWRDMNDNQRSALLSFSFNLGANFYASAGFNTITGVLKNKRWADVPSALLLYVNPGTSVEAGLTRRRKAEGALWLA